MCYRGMQELRGVLYSRILCYEFAENKKMEKIDWNWILKELIRNCRNIGREIVIVCVMVIVEILDLGNRSGENERIWDIN